MKKTLTVNLNSIVFNIDDDAYEVLSKYLADIVSHLSSNEEKDEIMADIEARIAELFNERLQRNKEVVTINDVREIIGIMGNPNQFTDEDEDSEESSASSASSEKKKKGPRRFYRDPGNSVLGGVCGGIAAQFNWVVTIVRIAVIALTILMSIVGSGWIIILAYILALIIAPSAITVSQRLEMQGEEVTVENIKAEFDNFKNYVESEDFKSTTKTLGQRLGEIFGWVLKILAGFIGVILVLAGFIIIIVLFASLVAVLFVPTVFIGFIPDFILDWLILTPEKSVMFVIALLLVIGCPIFLFIYSLIRLASGHKSKSRSRTTFWVTLVLWLAGVFMLIGTTAKTAIEWKNQEDDRTRSIYWNYSKKHSGDPTWNGVNSEVYSNEVRNMESEFKAIDIVGNVEIEIEDSPNQLLVVSAPEDFMNHVITEVKNETLYIYFDRNSISRQPIKVSLSTNRLESITAKGMAKITGKSTVESDNLYMLLQGAAKADLKVNIKQQFEIKLEGASSIELAGVCETLKLNAFGASEIDAEKLKAKHADVYMTGTSSAELYAFESLNADAKGVAKIVCYGNPMNINKTERFGTNIEIKKTKKIRKKEQD